MDLATFVRQHGQQDAAETLGVSQSAISHWLRGRKPITGERAIKIEERTGGKVTRYELRPDMFGPAPCKRRNGNAAA